jgi:hypothetical protein
MKVVPWVDQTIVTMTMGEAEILLLSLTAVLQGTSSMAGHFGRHDVERDKDDRTLIHVTFYNKEDTTP